MPEMTKRWGDFRYSPRQFGIWRTAFGLYLAIAYFRTYPYAGELLGREGPFVERGLAFPELCSTLWPDFLFRSDSALLPQAVVAASAVLSVLFALGLQRRLVSAALWLLAVWQFNRNPYSTSPESAFVDWLLFACIFIPEGEGFGFSKPRDDWKMPALFYWGAWLILSLGYLLAGYIKIRLGDPFWRDGSAIYWTLVVSDARQGWFGSWLDNLSPLIYVPLTYGALATETLTPLLVAFRRVRPWWWLVSTLTHLSALLFLNLGQLTLGMIFFHFFVADYRWLNVRIEFVNYEP